MVTPGQAVSALRRELTARLGSAPRAKEPRLQRAEVELTRLPILEWLGGQSFSGKFYWQERDQSYEMAGVGRAVRLGGASRNLDPLFQRMQDLLAGNPGTRFYGGLAFPGRKSGGEWRDFGDSLFLAPRFEVVRRGRGFFLACNWLASRQPPGELLANLLRELDQLDFQSKAGRFEPPSGVRRRDHPDLAGFQDRFQRAQHAMASGRLDKIVLARSTELRFPSEPDPWQWLQSLQQAQQPTFGFGVQPGTGNVFIGCTPELLYSRDGRHLLLEALAGTRPRGRNRAEDRKFRDSLRSSPKERHEHRLVLEHVQAVMRDLRIRREGTMKFQVHPLKHLQHLRTVFRGRFQGPASDAALIRALHPTAAVGGWPVREALSRLRVWEPFRRGWYSGLVGWVGRDSARFGVGIRSALFSRKQVRVYAGVGVVKDSTCAEEWRELETKIEPYLQLSGAKPHAT